MVAPCAYFLGRPQPPSSPQTGIEEIGARAALSSTAFPRTGILESARFHLSGQRDLAGTNGSAMRLTSVQNQRIDALGHFSRLNYGYGFECLCVDRRH